ncbi:MAG: hypothetical protein ACF8PG_06235 [Maioricimonas sp. JB045]
MSRLACLFALLISAPAIAQQPASTSPFYPTAVGTEWTFRSGPFEIIERITKHEVVDGENCARVETIFNGKVVSHEHIAVRKDGVYRVSVAGTPVVPPLQIIHFPVQDGASWAIKSTVKGQSVAGTFTLGAAQVTVPAGKFQTITVSGKDFGTKDKPLAFTYHFAPEVGKVKLVVAVGDRSTVLELKEFKPGN